MMTTPATPLDLPAIGRWEREREEGKERGRGRSEREGEKGNGKREGEEGNERRREGEGDEEGEGKESLPFKGNSNYCPM